MTSLVWLLVALLGRLGDACLPNGLSLGSLGGSSCGCSQCPCGASPSFGASYQPVYQRPIVQPPVYSASSYQGHYANPPTAYQHDQHQLPIQPINPNYYGRAPLGFPGESPHFVPIPSAAPYAQPTTPPPPSYVEHVALTHSALPASASSHDAPADPFASLGTHKSDMTHQIEVAPSVVGSAEDQYIPHPHDDADDGNSTQKYITYYNQVCTGEKLATAQKETILSATKKCTLLGCVAANAQPDSFGTYSVTFLRSGTGRVNRKGYYCLSSKNLAPKSKRVIRRFEDMEASEETRRVRRLLWRRQMIARS